MKHYSHIQSAKQLIEGYNGKEPFHRYIRAFFAQHKKYGSRDRRQISGLCYAYWRLGAALDTLSVEDRILAGHFLCTTGDTDAVLENLKPEWNAALNAGLAEKFTLITGEQNAYETEISKVFPWLAECSSDIDRKAFADSFFIQPDLFLRLRPGKEKQVKDKLIKAGVSFNELSPASLSMPNSTKIDALITLNTEAVVQDLSSQQVGEFMELVQSAAPTIRLWDCCAGSGGKTILASDKFKKLSITVSDKREQILTNLNKRFREAGIAQFQSFLVDMAVGSGRNPVKYNYDLIIADVPCSGSGTWGRSPEWLRFFDAKEIDNYSALQKKIVHNAIPHVAEGGYFLYITCSVFKKENEEVVEFIQSNQALQLVRSAVLKGYHRKADTMFAALFQRK